MKKYIIGYDIGGTKSTAVLADVHDGIVIIDRLQFPTPFGYPNTKKLLIEESYELLKKHSLLISDVIAVGISCGGPLDGNKGIILSPPNLPGWDDIRICEDITNELGVPAYLEHDANACALVEWKLGAGRGTENMMFLTMGTGFGAGIITEGSLLIGASYMAGEIGHIRLKETGPEGFGKFGSIEGFCSGAGIAKQAVEYTKSKLTGTESGKVPKWISDGVKIEDITTKIIAEYAHAGDPDAVEIINMIGENLGNALSIFIDAFNPECIVIGSIFVRCEKFLRPAMQRAIDKEALNHSSNVCEIRPAQTGESLGDLASILAACYKLGLDSSPFEIKKPVIKHYDRLFERFPQLDPLKEKIMYMFKTIARSYHNGGKLLVCGNGGSAADADHIVGELMKGFYKNRELNKELKDRFNALGSKLQGALPAISLTQHTALSTAFANDEDPSVVFAQQVYGYGSRGDILIGISTSGNSANVINAIKVAKIKGMITIGLTGEKPSEMTRHCDICIDVPAHVTAEIQELHLPIYHTLCAMLEEEFF